MILEIASPANFGRILEKIVATNYQTILQAIIFCILTKGLSKW